jgi:hypothetical protein
VDDWLRSARDAVASTASVEAARLELTSEDEAALLELARVAAHDSGERINAPLLAYLVGRASSLGDASLLELSAAVHRVGP